MHTSKLTSLHILFGMLLLIGALSMPVQAKTVSSGNEYTDRAFAEKPPTNTKKAKATSAATSAPKKTATPQPAATRTPASQNTSIPPASSTPIPISQPTQVSTQGAPSTTPNGTVTVSTVVTSAFSATPTALEMSTVVAQRTETAGASFQTSTALANAYSPTPTNIGAPTTTGTSTPNTSESTATSVALTTSPMAAVKVSITFIPASPTLSPTAVQASASFTQTRTPQTWKKISWIFGTPVLFVLAYLTYREWKKYSL